MCYAVLVNQNYLSHNISMNILASIPKLTNNKYSNQFNVCGKMASEVAQTTCCLHCFQCADKQQLFDFSNCINEILF